VRFAPLEGLDAEQREQLAALTFESARSPFPEWLPDLAAAREEIDDALAKIAQVPHAGERANSAHAVGRVLVDDDGGLVAWGAVEHSWGGVWELHPLLVSVAHQRKSHGRVLVTELERLAAEQGAVTLFLGTSDAVGATSIGGVDLYDDPRGVLGALAAISTKLPEGHAYRFWQRCGFVIVGVIPDGDAIGVPSIQLAKRIARAGVRAAAPTGR